MWRILTNKDFEKALCYYLEHSNKKSKKGPITELEDDWTEAFYVMGEAYKHLAKTTLAETVFNTHVNPVLTFISDMKHDASSAAKQATSITKKTATMAIASSFQEDSLLVQLFDSMAKKGAMLLPAFADFPGPPCLIFALIDAYGMRISTKYIGAKSHIPAKLLANIIEQFSLGTVTVRKSMEKELKALIKSGKLRNGEVRLSEICRDTISTKSPGLVVKGQMLQALLFVFALSCLIDGIHDNDEKTLQSWLAIISSGSYAACEAVWGFDALYRKLITKTAVSKGVTVAGNALTIVGGVACAIVSFNQAKSEISETDYIAGLGAAISTISGVSTSVGTVLLMLNITPLGTALICVAAIMGIASVAISLINDSVKSKTMLLFEAMLEGRIKGERYKTLYSQNKLIEAEIHSLSVIKNSFSWWYLSSAATVPLKQLGIPQNTINSVTTAPHEYVVPARDAFGLPI